MKKPVQHAVRSECDGKEFSIAHPLAPYGVAVYEFAAKTDAKKKK